jgi:uncharacterized protein
MSTLPRAREITINIDPAHAVSGLLLVPRDAVACFVLAHGAGAGMTHPFLRAVADGLCERRVATLRYQFPYMQAGSKRPDRPQLAHATVRAAVAAASHLAPRVPLIAGGKSFGGRMTSQAQAETALPGVVGLAFLGFPLHPAGKPSEDRAEHLARVHVPMLFLQGTRDTLAEQSLLARVLGRLANATSYMVDNADHSFHVPARSGRRDPDVLAEVLDVLAGWIARLTEPGRETRGET